MSTTDGQRGRGMTYPIITAEMLEAHTACPGQVGLFRELFPNGARLTKANWTKAVRAGLDVWWAENLLTAPAWAEYKKVTAAALAEYNKVRAAAWAEHDKATAAAWAEYEKAIAAAWAEHDKATAAALLAALRAALTITTTTTEEEG